MTHLMSIQKPSPVDSNGSTPRLKTEIKSKKEAINQNRHNGQSQTEVVIALDVSRNLATMFVIRPIQTTANASTHLVIRNTQGRKSRGWIRAHPQQGSATSTIARFSLSIRALWRLMHKGPPTFLVNHRRASKIAVCVKRQNDIVVSKGLPGGLNALIVNSHHGLRDLMLTPSCVESVLAASMTQRNHASVIACISSKILAPVSCVDTIGAIVCRMADQLDTWQLIDTPLTMQTTAVMACVIVATADAY